MKENYSRLGDYIREVSVRNRGITLTEPMGINIDKFFMPSVANVIGTDLSNYKLVSKEQFACNLMHVGRDEKIPMAMHSTEKPIIVSPAYFVFEVTKTDVLLPEYLMMWFRRPEFDRNAWFYTDADVRGGMPKEALLDMAINIPPIDRQREIVSEYETLSNRIRLNEQLIAKLEDTAQTLYRQTFVDNIDPQNLPDGWRMGTIADFGKIITGKTPSTTDDNNFGSYMPFLTIPDMHEYPFVYKTERMLSKQGANSQQNKTIPANSICVSCIGTAGLVCITPCKCQTNQQINSIIINEPYTLYYLFFAIKGIKKIIQEHGIGGAVLNNLNKSDFENLPIIIPDESSMKLFHAQALCLFSKIGYTIKEITILSNIQSLLLSKMRK